jgi:hypothetical protein
MLAQQKPLITVRVDADVLEWSKAQEPGYQNFWGVVALCEIGCLVFIGSSTGVV